MIFIDAHNYLKRIYHGGGSPYGLFYETMMKYKDTEVEVVCDGPKSRDYRKLLHPGYKAGRNNGDDPVYWEVYNNCTELALKFPNTKVVFMTSGEADDYIAREAKGNDTIVSNDKDLWPLITKGVKILLNATSAVDLDLIEVKFGTRNPRLIYLYKALVGDPSDKIPGKRGFGKAAWEKLEGKENLLEEFFNGNFGEWPETVEMSWKLATPYTGIKGDILISEQDANPMAFIESKGIML